MDSALLADEARALLPAWVSWAGLAAAIGWGLLVALIWIPLALRFALPRWQDLSGHWTDRARRLASGRHLALACMLGVPMFAAVGVAFAWGPLRPLSVQHGAGLTFVVTLVVAWTVVGLHASRYLGAPVNWRTWWQHHVIKATYFHATLWVTIGLCFVVPLEVGPALFVVAAVGFGLILLMQRLVLPVLRATGLLPPAPDDVQALADDVLERVGLSQAPVLLMDSLEANAYALIGQHTLLVTRRALDVLSPAQLEAILAHEAGHLAQQSGPKLPVIIASTFALIPVGVAVAAERGLLALALFVLACLALLLGFSVIVLRKQRGLEQDADATAHAHVDETVYAEALVQLYAANLTLPAGGMTASHPALAERLAAAGVDAADLAPGQAAASGLNFRFLGPAIGLGLLTSVLFVGLPGAPELILEQGRDAASFRAAVALDGGGMAWRLAELGRLRAEAGDLAGGLVLVRLAVASDPGSKHSANVLEQLTGDDED